MNPLGPPKEGSMIELYKPIRLIREGVSIKLIKPIILLREGKADKIEHADWNSWGSWRILNFSKKFVLVLLENQ